MYTIFFLFLELWVYCECGERVVFASGESRFGLFYVICVDDTTKNEKESTVILEWPSSEAKIKFYNTTNALQLLTKHPQFNKLISAYFGFAVTVKSINIIPNFGINELEFYLKTIKITFDL